MEKGGGGTFRLMMVKAARQRWQRSPSTHSGAVEVENIASLSFSAGNDQFCAFNANTVSCKQSDVGQMCIRRARTAFMQANLDDLVAVLFPECVSPGLDEF